MVILIENLLFKYRTLKIYVKIVNVAQKRK